MQTRDLLNFLDSEIHRAETLREEGFEEAISENNWAHVIRQENLIIAYRRVQLWIAAQKGEK